MSNEIKDKVAQDLKESGGIRAEYIITDNAAEIITIRWDGERVIIKHTPKNPYGEYKVIILNYPREALDAVAFIKAVHSLIGGTGGVDEIHR